MRLIVLILLVLTFTSCEKNVDFEVEKLPPVLVVEAEIENGGYPFVILTKSTNYFKEIKPEILADLFVRDAFVTLSSDSQTQVLKEIQVGSNGQFKFYAYVIDFANINKAFKGELNKSYSLNIFTGGVLYKATTTIPNLRKQVDSIYFKKKIFTTDTTEYSMYAKITDPPNLGDYIRYYTERNNLGYFPGLNVFNDEIIDGTTYTIEVSPGFDRNAINQDNNKFRKNDTINLKISNINLSTYTFWNTWEYVAQSAGNPFANPGKVKGNISNGALGAFCGYGSQSITKIIK